MADDKTKTDTRERNQVAGGEDYEAQYFARRHGIGVEQARSLIDKFGTNREVLARGVEAAPARYVAWRKPNPSVHTALAQADGSRVGHRPPARQ
jgi:hypothetical protein